MSAIDNYPKPGKRPLSSTTPTIIEDENGEFFAAIGGSGGSKIFPAVFQTLVNLDWGLDASTAVEYGRVHDQLFPMTVDADNIYPANILDDLRHRGHNITGTSSQDLGSVSATEHCIVSDIGRVAAVVQLVTKQGNTIYGQSSTICCCHDFNSDIVLSAASDSRKRGKAAGY